jgi:hypothetical protein
VKKVATPPAPPSPVVAPKRAQPARRASTSVPVTRHSEAEVTTRPKREIHPSPPKDLPYAGVPKKNRKKRSKADASSEQLKYCGKILQELNRKHYYNIAYPFYEPAGASRHFLFHDDLLSTYYRPGGAWDPKLPQGDQEADGFIDNSQEAG